MDVTFTNELYAQLKAIISNDGAAGLKHAVMTGAQMGEYVVKKALADVSPIAPYKLDYLKTAHSDFSALLLGRQVSDKNRYEDMGVLLDRAKALDCLDAKVIDIIARIKNYRNGVMHDPEYQFDELEAHARLLELVTSHSDLFSKYLQIEVSAEDLAMMKKVLGKVEKSISDRLINKIIKSRDHFRSLSKEEKAAQLERGPSETGADHEIISNMLCPACFNKTLHYLLTVDVDWNPDGVIHLSSTWFECTACELQMSEYDFDDLYENPKEYINKNTPDESWKEFYQHQDFEQNAYEYM